MIVSCASKSTRKVKRLYSVNKRGNWSSTIKKILTKYNMSELWRDERKLLDLDGKGNRDAKTVLDHRRFWRGFIHNKIGNYEEQRWKAVMDKKPTGLMYLVEIRELSQHF